MGSEPSVLVPAHPSLPLPDRVAAKYCETVLKHVDVKKLDGGFELGPLAGEVLPC
jgi:hypothetical protein